MPRCAWRLLGARLAGVRSVLTAAAVAVAGAQAAERETKTGGLVVEHELVLAGSPETLYDALTGDNFLFDRFKPCIESGKHLERPVARPER
jgi:hypothetical protein